METPDSEGWPGPGEITSPSGFSRFSRQVTVTTPYTNLKQVVVAVYWTTVGGETSVSLQTYRSNS